MSEHLFVYGTLMRGANHAMHRVLANGADFVGEASYNGRLYRIAHYPGAVRANDPDEQVHGELYRLRAAADVLAALDDYEGCGPVSPQPWEYVRTLQAVTLARGIGLQAWVYLYNRSTDELERIPSGRFL